MHYKLFTKRKLLTILISSICLFIFSIILKYFIVPIVINSQIDKNIRLERGTDQWHRFKTIPYNLTLNITFFEVTNAYDVLHKNAKPFLKEKGPYIFDEIIKRNILKYNEDNNTIVYTRDVKFYFNQKKSGNLTLDDTINLINPAYNAILQSAPFGVETNILECADKMFKNGYLLSNFSINQLIFDGVRICDYNEPSCSLFCGLFLISSKLMEKVDDKETNEKYIKFSFLNYKTNEPDGVYEVKNGMDDIYDVAQLETWDNKRYTNFWSQKKNECDLVKGTDGAIFAPHITENTVISSYSTDICRNADAFYNGTGTYKNIDGFIYKTGPQMFYSKYENPEDDCFCIKKTKDPQGKSSCYLDGVMDLFTCFGNTKHPLTGLIPNGAPILISYPHFLYANEKYLENLDGDIKPDPEKHELYVLIDKYTGVPLKAHKRVQMSVVLRRFTQRAFRDITKNLRRTVLPIIWIDEGLDLPKEGLDLLNSLLYNTLSLVTILEWVFMILTLLSTIIFGILLIIYYKSYNKN